MKFKDLIIPLALSLITVWAIQFFFIKDGDKSDSQPRPGQSFVAPTQQEMTKPLQTTFAFTPEGHKGILTQVDTEYGVATFSEAGAVLDELSFKRILSGKERVLTPIGPSLKYPAFSLAFGPVTPSEYTLVHRDDTNETIRLKYEAQSPQGTISKEFVVHRTLPKIDVLISIDPHGQEVQPRLFIPAPSVSEADVDYPPKGLVYTDRQRLQKQKIQQLTNQFWFAPALFGAEDRYFINALVSDPDNFTRRGYYTADQPIAFVLEGPTIKQAQTWNLSFYLGPKDAHSMDAVDKRLNAALDYGWLSPLVKVMLTALKFLYKYVNNYGWAIILLTLIIRLLLLPITLKGSSPKLQERQKEYQRKMQYIEQKFKNDPDALTRERLELTRKYGLPDMLIRLPQLLQIPILLGLNRLLSSSVELYQAPFVGWITDLSARDPYYILPILAGAGLLIQAMVDSDIRKGVTMLLVAALIVAFTAHLSAGLTLYLCANAWLSLAQSYLQKVFKV